MPLYEFLKLAIENLEASKNKSCSTEQSSRTENNLDEVVREDSPTHQSLSPTTPNVLDASLGTSTIEYLNGFDSIFNEISPVAELDGLPDYLSDRLPEVSSVKTKGGSCDQAVCNLDKNFSFENFPLSSWPPQRGQTSDPSQLSGISSIVSNNTSDRHDGLFEDLTQGKDVGSPRFLNFSSFLRPAAAVKANLTVSGGVSTSVSSGFVEENGPACRCSNPVKSTPIQPLNSIQIDMALHVSSAQTAVDSGQVSVKKHKESFLDRGKDNFCRETVGSGNSGDGVSNAEPRNSRRKFCDVEYEYHSDDIQNESTGVKKPTPARQGTGSKKSRTSEVHNLSERRRRDRINEKMRALQELIPNCNKADKASMLDEAIQYLKYLQHQVQVMSMRGGYSVPQMMYSPGHQHMFHAPLHHCSHMGVGMGMSMSYGSMNSGSPHLPAPSIQENLQGSCGPNLLRLGCHSTATAPRPPLVPSAAGSLSFEDPMKMMKPQNEHHKDGGSQSNQATDR